jgi:hypothetical protein
MVVVRIRRNLASTISLFLILFSSSLFADCTLIVNSDRVQCHTNEDCASRGGAFASASCIDSVCKPDPTWECLAASQMPSPQAPPFRIAVTLRDLVTQTPVANAQVKLCRKIDVDCATPSSAGSSDGHGEVSFTVDMVDFTGYLAVQASGIVPKLYFFNPPVDRDQAVTVSLASPAAYTGLLLQLGRQPAPGHGSIVISAADCTGAPATGVTYATSNGDTLTSAFYTVKGLPTLSGTATDSDGYGGLINVPAGAATVDTSLVSPRTNLGTISLLVQDGAITYSRVVPRDN